MGPRTFLRAFRGAFTLTCFIVLKLHAKISRGGSSAWLKLLTKTKPPPTASSSLAPAPPKVVMTTSPVVQATTFFVRAAEAAGRFLGWSDEPSSAGAPEDDAGTTENWGQYSFFDRRDVQRPADQRDPLRVTSDAIQRTLGYVATFGRSDQPRASDAEAGLLHAPPLAQAPKRTPLSQMASDPSGVRNAC